MIGSRIQYFYILNFMYKMCSSVSFCKSEKKLLNNIAANHHGTLNSFETQNEEIPIVLAAV